MKRSYMPTLMKLHTLLMCLGLAFPGYARATYYVNCKSTDNVEVVCIAGAHNITEGPIEFPVPNDIEKIDVSVEVNIGWGVATTWLGNPAQENEKIKVNSQGTHLLEGAVKTKSSSFDSKKRVFRLNLEPERSVSSFFLKRAGDLGLTVRYNLKDTSNSQ